MRTPLRTTLLLALVLAPVVAAAEQKIGVVDLQRALNEVDEGKAAIIDLDWACRGDPADDLGGILAQVERHAVCGGLPHARAASFREALLLSYRKATRRPLPERIGLYRAVELFRGARFPFRKYEPEWPRQIRSLLLHTEGVLGRSETR